MSDEFDAAMRANKAVMDELRRGSAAALQRRIDTGKLLSASAFREAMGMSAESLDEVVMLRRMFTVSGPTGAPYFPAFFADKTLDVQELGDVTNALGNLAGTSKYFFFTNPSTNLGAVTPLDALRNGQLDDVLETAEAFLES